MLFIGTVRSLRLIAVSTAIAIVSACAAPNAGGFRDPDAPLSASSRFDSAAFSGSWQIVESFGAAPSGTITFAAGEGDVVTVSGTRLRGVDGRFREGVPGELLPEGEGRPSLIVMWVDESGETAAIGTVSGSFGALIDRDGRVPPDKALAARAIFEFYGWDTSQISKV
jgi:apolipoprotein D and lipocalin family protein